MRCVKRRGERQKLASPKYGDRCGSGRGNASKGDIVLVEKVMLSGDGRISRAGPWWMKARSRVRRTGYSRSGGDPQRRDGGTRSFGWLVVRITTNPGEAFLDHMIAMVEGAKRQKTPNEIALNILLVALSIIFLLVTIALLSFSIYGVDSSGQGDVVSLTVLVALLVCLMPTTIGGLLSAIGIAGMDRMVQANVIAVSGRAVEAAGDVNVLLLDKTGTITLGNRQATAFLPAQGITPETLADAAQLSSLADETPKAAALSCWRKTSTGSPAGSGGAGCNLHPIHRADPDERH
jgi:K+-transporting ATPase ATPase B chain